MSTPWLVLPADSQLVSARKVLVEARLYRMSTRRNYVSLFFLVKMYPTRFIFVKIAKLVSERIHEKILRRLRSAITEALSLPDGVECNGNYQMYKDTTVQSKNNYVAVDFQGYPGRYIYPRSPPRCANLDHHSASLAGASRPSILPGHSHCPVASKSTTLYNIQLEST